MDKIKVKEKLKNGIFKAVDPDPTKFSSEHWKNFAKVINEENKPIDFAICKLCKDIVHYLAANGTNGLKRHSCISKANAVLATPRLSSFINQSIIPDTLKKSFSKSCLMFVAKDIRPYNVVSGDGFRQLIQTATDIGATAGKFRGDQFIPHPVTVARKTQTIATEGQKVLINHIKENIDHNRCAMTMDMWSDDYRKLNYLTITLHYIDNGWCQLHERVLSMAKFPNEKKTGENVYKEVCEITKKFGFVSLDSVVFVTDQGSNIIATLKTEKRLSCAAHMLNTVLTHTFSDTNLHEAGLSNVVSVIGYCRDLVGYFKRSNSMYKLNTALQQVVATRWNSNYFMLESVEKNYTKILAVTPEEEMYRITCINNNLVKELVKFLTPFKEAMDIFEMPKKPTLHRMVPCLRTLEKWLSPNSMDISLINKLKESAKKYLAEKFKLDELHFIALFLDPKRCQLKAIKTNAQCEKTIDAVQQMIADIEIKQEEPAIANDHSSYENRSLKRRKVGNTMDDDEWGTMTKVKKIQQPLKFSMKSIRIKICQRRPDEDFDLLQWWKDRQKQFPRLSNLAKYVLSILASSALSERNFSAAGLMVDKLCSNINHRNVDDLLFVRSNFDLVKTDEVI